MQPNGPATTTFFIRAGAYYPQGSFICQVDKRGWTGKNSNDMKTVMNISNYSERLLGALDFDQVLETVASILDHTFNPQAIAILIWDPDLETFEDRKLFGPQSERLTKLVQAFAAKMESALDLSSPPCAKIDTKNYDAEADSTLLADCYYLRLQTTDQLAACIILAGIKDLTAEEIPKQLENYPLLLSLQNGWEIREIKRENERLRSRYDDLEERNSELQEETRKLIQDIRLKDGLRYRNIEQEKLIYQISNTVRSSVEIEQVLQNAVMNVGEKCYLSRCIILRPSATSHELFVYEYHDTATLASRDLFFSDLGKDFVRTALSKSAPCDLSMDGKPDFDIAFLKQFNFLSALFVPLIMRGRTIGCIFVQDCGKARPWSIEDLTFFGAVADQLSVAVENADLHEEKKLQAVTDALTGLSNRRRFNDIFQKEFERAKRYEEPLSLVMIDLDFMKSVNDQFGHAVGDNAIKMIATILSNSSRSIDLPARYGGEEFCLLLPNTMLDESTMIAERIRKLINETLIDGPGNISASLGIATFPEHASDPDQLFERADQALYAAKQAGRNRVCVYNQ